MGAAGQGIMTGMKRYLPTREKVKQMRELSFLGNRIFEPNLWHFNRYSLSVAFLVGGICTFLPIPFQMIPCVLLCVWVRCNIPLALVVVWISNPITMGPMMFLAYRVGGWVLGIEQEFSPIDPSFEWFTEQISIIWLPLVVGCVVCGVTLGMTGFTAIRLYYRWRITRYKQRKIDARKEAAS